MKEERIEPKEKKTDVVSQQMSEHQILERGKKTYSNLLQASS